MANSVDPDQTAPIVKEEKKVANRDWVDHQACSLLQYMNGLTNLLIMGNYLNKLR